MTRIVVVIMLLIVSSINAFSQVDELPERYRKDRQLSDQRGVRKGKAILLHMGGGIQSPGGDMSERFGNNGVIGLGLEYANEQNWFWGLEGHYFFGNSVKEDPLDILRTFPEGDIIGNNRTPASVVLRERGWYMGFGGGKLIPLIKDRRAGIRIGLSAGWVQHKIRVQDDNSSVSQLAGDYVKGYDRLTGGPALNEFVGWQQFGSDKGWNFMIGLEFNQGFTNTLRDWDFTERRKLDDSRLDLRFGIRANWTLPFYIHSAEKIYY